MKYILNIELQIKLKSTSEKEERKKAKLFGFIDMKSKEKISRQTEILKLKQMKRY